MAEHRGHLGELDRLQRIAFADARRLGSMAVGPEELLLATVHPDATGYRPQGARSVTRGSIVTRSPSSLPPKAPRRRSRVALS